MTWQEQQEEQYQKELHEDNNCSFCNEPCEHTHCSKECVRNDYTDRI